MIKFEYQYHDPSNPNYIHPKITLELDPNSDLDQILEGFESFLKAAGYAFEGELDFITTGECDEEK